MNVPQQLTLTEIQRSFQDIQQILKPISGPIWDLAGRRIRNVGSAIQPFDCITKFDLSTELGVLETRLKAAPDRETLLRLKSSIRIGAFATRGSAVAFLNKMFIASDRGYVAWVSDGANWRYVSGIETNTLANLRAGLGSPDQGYLFWVSDYSHLLQWTGSAWQWAPGDVGSGFYQLFEAAPAGYGATAWQVCDGSTVARLNADGTTTNVTLDNLGTAAYLKGGTSSAAVAAAGGTAANATATNQATTATNQNTVAVNQASVVTAHSVIERLDAAGAGVFVFDAAADANHASHNHDQDAHNHTQNSHNHTQNAHNHGPGTLELRRKLCRLYFRR